VNVSVTCVGQIRRSLACDHRQCRGDIPISTERDRDFHEIIPNFDINLKMIRRKAAGHVIRTKMFEF
jgi:hypothetical protein